MIDHESGQRDSGEESSGSGLLQREEKRRVRPLMPQAIYHRRTHSPYSINHKPEHGAT